MGQQRRSLVVRAVSASPRHRKLNSAKENLRRLKQGIRTHNAEMAAAEALLLGFRLQELGIQIDPDIILGRSNAEALSSAREASKRSRVIKKAREQLFYQERADKVWLRRPKLFKSAVAKIIHDDLSRVPARDALDEEKYKLRSISKIRQCIVKPDRVR